MLERSTFLSSTQSILGMFGNDSQRIGKVGEDDEPEQIGGCNSNSRNAGMSIVLGRVIIPAVGNLKFQFWFQFWVNGDLPFLAIGLAITNIQSFQQPPVSYKGSS